MNILLFGKTGQVGWELQRALAPLGNLIALDVHSTGYQMVQACDFWFIQCHTNGMCRTISQQLCARWRTKLIINNR